MQTLMIKIGNFFFKYRNLLFIPLYLALFIPSPEILTSSHHSWLLFSGLLITLSGQVLRGATIGLAYIERGGKNKQVYASKLVTQGLFNHCRNPLYIGNIFMLLGVGILSNSLLYITVFIPAFLFIYQAIVLTEENFLRHKFGVEYENYCLRTHRWLPKLSGLRKTFESMQFNWRRWLAKEYNTQFVWLLGLTFILLFKYPELSDYDTVIRNHWLLLILPSLMLFYCSIRYLKKSKKLRG